jgi:hypothetical protein
MKCWVLEVAKLLESLVLCIEIVLAKLLLSISRVIKLLLLIYISIIIVVRIIILLIHYVLTINHFLLVLLWKTPVIVTVSFIRIYAILLLLQIQIPLSWYWIQRVCRVVRHLWYASESSVLGLIRVVKER